MRPLVSLVDQRVSWKSEDALTDLVALDLGVVISKQVWFMNCKVLSI